MYIGKHPTTSGGFIQAEVFKLRANVIAESGKASLNLDSVTRTTVGLFIATTAESSSVLLLIGHAFNNKKQGKIFVEERGATLGVSVMGTFMST